MDGTRRSSITEGHHNGLLARPHSDRDSLLQLSLEEANRLVRQRSWNHHTKPLLFHCFVSQVVCQLFGATSWKARRTLFMAVWLFHCSVGSWNWVEQAWWRLVYWYRCRQIPSTVAVRSGQATEEQAMDAHGLRNRFLDETRQKIPDSAVIFSRRLHEARTWEYIRNRKDRNWDDIIRSASRARTAVTVGGLCLGLVGGLFATTIIMALAFQGGATVLLGAEANKAVEFLRIAVELLGDTSLMVGMLTLWVLISPLV